MVIQVFNSKLGIREPYTKIHKHGLNHGIMTYR